MLPLKSAGQSVDVSGSFLFLTGFIALNRPISALSKIKYSNGLSLERELLFLL